MSGSRFERGLQVLQTRLFPENYSLTSGVRMQKMKSKGCVYDGLLTPRYNSNFTESVEMLNRSGCQYIHRAVETWNISPDFTEIERRIKIIKEKTGRDFIYGFFLAESIDITKRYYDPKTKRYFYYSKMCAPGTIGSWGKNTCKPTLQKKEYRDYVKAVMKRGIDIGIRDFTFGQIYYQDSGWRKDASLVRRLIGEIKSYAEKKGMEISIGAQTNTIDNEEYLRSFDYITGGIGQHSDGTIEKGNSCWSYYRERNGYCWALLWNEKYKNRANNVFVYLDWNNSYSDDIHRFTRMEKEKRAEFLAGAYDFFLWRRVGFLLPLGAVLGNVGSGCYGPSREFYSASQKYSCQDEIAINNILNGGDLLPNHSKFVKQNVPKKMIAGKKYLVQVTMKNTSFRTWRKSDGFKLGSVSPQDNFTWGKNRVYLNNDDEIRHNQNKEFVFEVTAPQKSGKYVWQWKMLEEGRVWFGETTEKIIIQVTD